MLGITQCECGARKKPIHEKCWGCFEKGMKEENRLCACGAFKKPYFASCFRCASAKGEIPPQRESRSKIVDSAVFEG